jgi:predicted DNA-binding protein
MPTPHISFRIDSELRRLLRQESERLDVSESTVLRLALEAYFGKVGQADIKSQEA